jgi:ankyrin repeat protein
LPHADPYLRDNEGSDALCIAALRGDDAMVTLLLTRFDPRSASNEGITALMCAAAHGDHDCIDILLELSDPEALDLRGDDAAAIARKNGNEGAALTIESYILALDILSGFRSERQASARPSNRRGKSP